MCEDIVDAPVRNPFRAHDREPLSSSFVACLPGAWHALNARKNQAVAPDAIALSEDEPMENDRSGPHKLTA
ncbi:hypothetical protein LJR034_008940 [Caballeronia sp. LjRoot34]|uniref:hypothetical protein n=1 Tax=Caballeronia sp. LjRoot34 TaxID=3342325 RepID=UPI003ECE4BEA